MSIRRRILLTALPFVVAMTMTGATLAADANGAERAVNEACERVGVAAAALQRQLDSLERSFAEALTHTRAEITRELAPMMRAWSDRLRALARELEQSQIGHDS